MDEDLELLEQRLRNRRILVVEDEAPTALLAETVLTDCGCSVFLAHNILDAHKIAGTQFVDCALLDIGIGQEDVFSVADALTAKSVPFVFSSGYGKEDLPARYQSRIILAKPYLIGDVVRALVAEMDAAKTSRPMESFDIADHKAGGDSDPA